MPTTYAIPDGRVAMAATLYTGTGSSLSVSNAVNGVSFQPDWVWTKSRSAAESHRLYDSVRGATKSLYSNLTNAEATEAQSLTAFGTSGFTLGTGAPNTSAATYVAWNWKAGGTAVSNTAGSITSSVSANTTAGFSVVTFTTNNTAGATIGHGLGVVPSMIIMKYRSLAGTNWVVYHSSMSATPQNGYLNLNTTGAFTSSTDPWNNTAPTSSVITMGAGVGSGGSTNYSVQTSVAYCFAPVAGYSAMGSYVGNGSSDGPFIYTGMRPRLIMMKRTDVAADWWIQDTSRNPSNAVNKQLYANTADADSTDNWSDILSNGFKIRNTYGGNNASGGTYIYMAFAENPFKYANAR